jgi:asparagine synthase (glutamine-hydrolysing)
MCGIVGIFGKSHSRLINSFNETIKHRGPDDKGIFTEVKKEFSIGMQRLSIIDIKSGHQPMKDNLNGNIIVFNGEIFNSNELRNSMLNEGISFSTNNSDTEVLLKLYSKYNIDMLHLINGMFSFAIYDCLNNKIFIARDRFGIKPLYFFNKNDHFIFSSELKSFGKIPFINKEVDLISLRNYLTYQFIPSPRSIFKDINKLEPSKFIIYDLKEKKLEIKKYNKLKFNDRKRITNKSSLLLELRSHLEKSVNKWSNSDVPIGLSLSGGIDSTIILGILSKYSDKPIRTWSLGFNDDALKEIDERNLAKIASQKYNSDHTEITISSEDILNDLDEMTYSLDEPYGGGLPSWYIYKEMSKHIKVCMTGTGGDELFGNYAKWLPYKSLILGVKKLRNTLKDNGFMNFIKYPRGCLYPNYMGEFQSNDILKIKSFSENPLSIIDGHIDNSNTNNIIDSYAYLDFNFQLTDEFLHMTDRFSMNFSIEARTPFLDHELVNFIFNIHNKDRINRENLKKLLIESTIDLLPNDIINSNKKGFIIPHDLWLNGKLKKQASYLFSEEYISKQNIFNSNLNNNIIKPYFKGDSKLANKVWTIFMFQMWWDKNILLS